MKILHKIKSTLRSWSNFNQRSETRADLAFILNSAKDAQTFGQKVDWIIRLFTWIRVGPKVESERKIDPVRIPGVRLKYILNLLERNDEWRTHLARVIYDTLTAMSAVDLLSNVGMGHQYSFMQELWERISEQILPEAPLHEDLSTLIVKLLPSESDVHWVEAIDVEVISRLIKILQDYRPNSADWTSLSRDMENAIILLLSQIQASGFGSDIRSRLEASSLHDLPFYHLNSAGSEVLQVYRAHPKEALEKKIQLHRLLDACYETVQKVYAHLDKHGVSVSIVFKIERMRRQIDRVRMLTNLLTAESDFPTVIRDFTSHLTEEIQSKKGIRHFIRQNLDLLTLKVVERNSEIGTHYITRSREEYFEMLRKAMGGGAITSITVYIKFVVTAIGASQFMTGIMASINYSLSFVGIQILGFTLATKQPASTAPALAAKLKRATESPREVTNEIVSLLRTQVIAIFGNLLMVFPLALIVDITVFMISGHHILSHHKAVSVMESTDIFGPTLLYASFTGLLLFLSSLFAGWIDNWFVYRRIRERIALNEKFRFVLGEAQALQVAEFINKNMAGFAGSVSLGFLLGLSPEFLDFLGVPLEVRHVTLATGSLAAAIPSLDYNDLFSWAFLRAWIGIGSIGLLNVVVSFSLAFWLATRATGVSGRRRWLIYGNVLHVLRFHPERLFLPPKDET